MTTRDIIQHRLHNQQISLHAFKKPDALVSWMGALQAQDYAGAKWSLGLRLSDHTDKKTEAAFAEKTILRTWALRGTLHIISAADVWWLLELLGPVVVARNAAQFRKHELDPADFKKIHTVLIKLLEGGNMLTRKELFDKLEQHKIRTQDQRGSHILYKAALEKIICLGTLSGKQETYTLLEEWLPKSEKRDRDEALTTLAKRYFDSHGPATLQDFAWWSGLTNTDAKKGLEMVQSTLQKIPVEENIYWCLSQQLDQVKKKPSAVLLQGYDEYFIGYKDRSIVLDSKYKKLVEPGNGFSPVVMIDGEIKGTWRRTIKKEKVEIETNFFSPLNAAQKEAVALAETRYKKYLA